MKTGARLAGIAAILLALAVSPAAAQSSGDWEFTVAPYLLGASMDGTVGVKNLEASIDMSFGDIWDHLHFAGMGYFAMKNDRWFLSGSLDFVTLDESQEAAHVDADVKVRETFLEVSGGYRISKPLTLLAGFRVNDLRETIDIDAGELGSESATKSRTWVDPFVGFAATMPVTDHLWIDMRGDVGGFGLGSDLAWQAWADLGWRASKNISLFVGYHVLDIDYEDGSGSSRFRYDVTTAGPQIGAAFHF